MPRGIEFQLVGDTEALEEIIDSWEVSGLTVWQAINRVIDRRKGMGCWLEVNHKTNTVQLRTFSITDRPIAYGLQTIPANGMPVYWEQPDEYPYTHLAGDLSFRVTTQNQFDRLVVRGERGFHRSTSCERRV